MAISQDNYEFLIQELESGELTESQTRRAKLLIASYDRAQDPDRGSILGLSSDLQSVAGSLGNVQEQNAVIQDRNSRFLALTDVKNSPLDLISSIPEHRRANIAPESLARQALSDAETQENRMRARGIDTRESRVGGTTVALLNMVNIPQEESAFKDYENRMTVALTESLRLDLGQDAPVKHDEQSGEWLYLDPATHRWTEIISEGFQAEDFSALVEDPAQAAIILSEIVVGAGLAALTGGSSLIVSEGLLGSVGNATSELIRNKRAQGFGFDQETFEGVGTAAAVGGAAGALGGAAIGRATGKPNIATARARRDVETARDMLTDSSIQGVDRFSPEHSALIGMYERLGLRGINPDNGGEILSALRDTTDLLQREAALHDSPRDLLRLRQTRIDSAREIMRGVESSFGTRTSAKEQRQRGRLVRRVIQEEVKRREGKPLGGTKRGAPERGGDRVPKRDNKSREAEILRRRHGFPEEDLPIEKIEDDALRAEVEAERRLDRFTVEKAKAEARRKLGQTGRGTKERGGAKSGAARTIESVAVDFQAHVKNAVNEVLPESLRTGTTTFDDAVQNAWEKVLIQHSRGKLDLSKSDASLGSFISQVAKNSTKNFLRDELNISVPLGRGGARVKGQAKAVGPQTLRQQREQIVSETKRTSEIEDFEDIVGKGRGVVEDLIKAEEGKKVLDLPKAKQPRQVVKKLFSIENEAKQFEIKGLEKKLDATNELLKNFKSTSRNQGTHGKLLKRRRDLINAIKKLQNELKEQGTIKRGKKFSPQTQIERPVRNPRPRK